MTPFETYKLYLALKNHFTKESYDFFKYNGKASGSVKSFEARRDRYYFEKISRHRDPRNFLIANIVKSAGVWIGELAADDGAESTYLQFIKRNNSLSYTVREDLSQLDDDFDSNFKTSNGGHPLLLKLYLRNKVCIETLIILMHLTKCLGSWNRAMEYDPVWKEVSLRVRKYQPFMTYDLNTLKKLVVDNFNQR